MKAHLSQYCCGCGLCKCLGKANLSKNNNGFYYVEDGQTEWLEKICPAGAKGSKYCSSQSIWGHYTNLYYTWSTDISIRHLASSGGTLTAIALYLLESKKVDGIIHTTFDTNDPCNNAAVISETQRQVIDRCGSRYSISHPLSIIDKINRNKRYAFIGKPCDIVALRNYLNEDPELRKSIKYLLSFFCMGLPSKTAQEKLFERLGCGENTIQHLTYRGNGWPGFTTAEDNKGNRYQLDYETAWGKFLGRDLMPLCKFCIDGVGEAADIACADGWFVKNGEPDFSEHDGRNITFARNEIGATLLKEVAAQGYIHMEKTNEKQAELSIIQRSQFERRAALKGRILAARIMREPVPEYCKTILNQYAKYLPYKQRCRMFLGMVKRLLKKRKA